MRIAHEIMLDAIKLLLETYPVMKISEAAAVVEQITPSFCSAEDVASVTAYWLYHEAWDVIETERCYLVMFAETLRPCDDIHTDEWALERVLDVVLAR